MKKVLRSRSVSTLGATAALCFAFASVAHAQGPAGAAMPNEGCSTPTVIKFPGCDASTEVRDAGAGMTTVATYGSAERHVPMPLIEDGMHGLAKLYHRTFVFDASFTAWNGESTNLKGGGLLVPNMDAANLAGEDPASCVQPRPGTMPGLYLLQSEGETQEFLHYGGPLESGANPQTTAVYQLATGGGGGGRFQPAFLPAATTAKYTNNLSGAELWHYTGATPPYVEIKHVDGSIARFDSFNPWTSAYTSGPGANLKLWRVTQVRDPYDNVATYSYESAQSHANRHRLTQIAFPSGVTQKFNYNPNWTGWSSVNCVEITYEQGSTALPDRTWGLAFLGTTGTAGGNHFGKRLYRTYSAFRTVLPDPAVGQPHTITSNYAVQGQIVSLFSYDTTNRVLTESQAVHTGTPFAASLLTPSGLNTVDVLSTHYLGSGAGTNAGRVSAQTLSLLGHTITTSYPSSGFRTLELLPGTVMQGIEVSEPSGSTSFTVRRFEFDRDSGRLYSVITTPSSDAAGKPRAAHVSGENSGIGGVAGTDIEPDSITIYNVFGTDCACLKPIERRVIAIRGTNPPYVRSTKFQYYADTKLLKKRSEPNPQAGAGGSFPAEVHWDYTYTQAKTGTQLWGAWLPLQESTPDGKWDYTYGEWLNRGDATNHGRIPGSIQRSITGVRQQSTLSGPPTASTGAVTETTYRNLANSPGGLTAMGNVRGQPRRTVDGDGVTTTYEYSAEGWLTAVDALSGVTRRTYSHNTYGEMTGVTEHASSSGHQATTTFTMMSGVGVAAASSSTSGGLLRSSQSYFDRWGHSGVERRNNLDSAGNQPSKHVGSSAGRAWVETQRHYQHRRLLALYQDRKPLDEAAGAGQFLVTQLEYHANGRLDYETNPNGSKTYYTFDGYGTLYRTLTKDPTGTVTVKGPKRFVNPFLEVTGSYEFDGTDHLWTTITRNGAGAVTQIVEPSLQTAPANYTPYAGGSFSTGGARHEFDLDVLGRVTKAQSFENTLLLTLREMGYDELGRQIWQHDEARTRAIGGAAASVVGQQYRAWKYQAGKATQLETVEQSGIAPTTYEYWSSGLLKRTRDGFSSGNTVEYAYAAGTPFVSQLVRTDLDPVTVTRVTTTEFSYDPFGRTTAIKEGSPQLLHTYKYNSLGGVDRYTDPAGREQKFLADAMGRIVEHVRIGDGSDYIRNSTLFEDSGFADGRTKTKRVDGQNHETITHVDFAGRPFIVQNPGGFTAPTPSAKNQSMCLYAEYDEASRITAVFDGETSVNFVRDGMGRVLLRAIGPVVGSKVALWNTADWFRRDALGRILENDYLGMGILWAEQRAEQDSIGRTHNENFKFMFAQGNAIDVASTFSGGNPYRSGLGYDDNLSGTGMSASSAPMSLAFTHDVIGRLTEVQWDRAPGGGTSMHILAEYQWSGGLRRTRSVRYGATAYPQGRSHFEYDVYGRLTEIKDNVWTSSSIFQTKSEFDYAYDAASNLIKEEYTKVVTGSVVGKGDRFAYDAYHRLQTAWMGVNAATMGVTANPTGFNASTMHEELTYGLDSANNRTTVTSETGAGSVATDYFCEGQSSHSDPSLSNRYERVLTGSSGYVVMEYDERGNLTYDGNFAYRYDYMNRLQEVWSVEPQNGLAPQEGEKFALILPDSPEEVREDVKDDVPDLMQRLIRDHKDPVFRARLKKALPGGVLRLQQTPQGGGGRPGFWPEPALMELVAVYLYDGYNRRTTSIVIGDATHLHVWDGWQQVQELDLVEQPTGTGSFWAKPMKQFVWGSRLDELISYRRLNGTTWETYFLLHGGQDTAAKLVDASGAVVEQYEYDPYGKVSVFTGTSTTAANLSAYGLPFLWKSVRLDGETGLLYMRNRYYHVGLGRFMTSDRLGHWADGMNFGNGYAYCGDNSLVCGDPMGLQGERPAPKLLEVTTVTIEGDIKVDVEIYEDTLPPDHQKGETGPSNDRGKTTVGAPHPQTGKPLTRPRIRISARQSPQNFAVTYWHELYHAMWNSCIQKCMQAGKTFKDCAKECEHHNDEFIADWMGWECYYRFTFKGHYATGSSPTGRQGDARSSDR